MRASVVLDRTLDASRRREGPGHTNAWATSESRKRARERRGSVITPQPEKHYPPVTLPRHPPGLFGVPLWRPPRRSPGVDPVVQNSLSAGPGWLNPSPGPQGSKSAPIPPSLDDQPRRLVRCTWQSTEGRERMRQLSDAVAILPPHRRPVCTRQSQIGVPQVLAGTISPAHLVNRLREHGNPPALIGKSPAITLRETCDGELQRKTAL